jgi:hypothetical protein
MPEIIYLRHVTGHCAWCGAPILNSGYDGDTDKWEHAFNEEENELAADTGVRVPGNRRMAGSD